MRKRLVAFLVPVAVLLVFLLLNLDFDGRLTLEDELEQVRSAEASGEPVPQTVDRSPAITTLEERVYDLFLHLRPLFGRTVEQREDVLFMDVDDTAIVQVGDWPWSRDYMARGLVLLREFESDFVTFDIEYVEDSPLAVDRTYLTERLPVTIRDEFFYLNDNFAAFVEALQSGQIPLSAADQVLPDLFALSDDIAGTLQKSVAAVVRDNDQLLGRAAAFHGQAYFTVNILDPAKIIDPDPQTYRSLIMPQENRRLAQERAAIRNVEHTGRQLRRTGVDILPAIPPILSGAAGAGFPNVVVDNDGVRRRIDLFAEVDGTYYAQLITAPLLDLLGNPAVQIDGTRILLSGAVLPGEDQPTDIRIPLASDGRMLINWPATTFLESFRHETFYRLVYHWETEADIVANLRVMADGGYLDFYRSDVFATGSELLGLYDFAESLREDVTDGGDRAQIAEWREYRQLFFDEVGALLGGETQAVLEDAYDAAITDPEVPPDLATQYRAAKDQAVAFYEATAELYGPFAENRRVLQEKVPGSKIIIGWTGTSTTDIGVNPFEQEYVNVGTHAAVYNTIVQQIFLDDTAWWIPFLIAAALSLLLTLIFVAVDLDPGPSLLIGFGTLIVIIAAGTAVFVFAGVYVNMVTPVLSVFLTFITLTIIKFITTNQEKKYIRNAFNHYLATDVINEILEDPDMLGLGGKRKNITAMFTDVRKFSTISERLEPEQLVRLLNRYLSGMSDVVLAERGLIDKFEGDAIIAMFGAPKEVDPAVHAMSACRAAVAMKKLERRLNEEFLRDGYLVEDMDPNQLLTRVGINTGDAVVGNMGTETRMDYTMMGNTVNLAARLEGVNKQFNTWTLISQATYDAIRGESDYQKEFTLRKLSKVIVVGLKEPVRIYELIDTYEGGDQHKDLVEKLKVFNCGLTAFENQEWGEAERCFLQVRVEFGEKEEEGPVGFYLKRIAELKKRPPGKTWSGEFKLSEK